MLLTNAAANNPTATLMTIFVMAALLLVFGLFTVATAVRAPPVRWPVLSLEGANSLGFCRASAIGSSPSQPAENTHNEPRTPRKLTFGQSSEDFKLVSEYASWRAGRSRPAGVLTPSTYGPDGLCEIIFP